ncbi:MAG: acyl-CoA thioesterase [Chloroflexi bacterium]|nr:acyl-CoA thioesterase [Chloroflexota bacterium]
MSYRYQVSFSDVDYARVLFFGRYYFIVQQASESLFHQYGIYYRDLLPQHDLRLPIVASFCRYLGPISVEEAVDVHLGIKDLSPRGFTLAFAFFRPGEERCLAWGYLERRFVSGPGAAREAPEAILQAFGAMAEATRPFVGEVWEPLAQRSRR